MLKDKNLFEYISYVISKEENITEDRIKAVQNYSSNYNYEKFCNYKLKIFAQENAKICPSESLISEEDFNFGYYSHFISDKENYCCSVHISGKNENKEKILIIIIVIQLIQRKLNNGKMNL